MKKPLLTVSLLIAFSFQASAQIGSETLIQDWNDLQGINEDIREGVDDQTYQLVNDLTSETAGYQSQVNSSQGWEPLGSSEDGFSGAFDGGENVIKDLKIDIEARDHVGLFGVAEESSEISDLGIVGAEVKGDAAAGILAGAAYGDEIRVFSTGSVSGQEATGGLIGVQNGVTDQSYSTAIVESENRAGGIIGTLNGAVDNSYSVGAVIVPEDPDNSGGLVGGSGTVRNSFAATRHKIEDAGGIIGTDGNIFNSYYDFDVADIEDQTGNNLSTEESTGDEAENNMEGLDFSDTWEVSYNTYPRLQWQETGDGSEQNPYKVFHCRDLQNIDRDVRAGESDNYYELAYDINCKDTENWFSYENSEAFRPIGGQGSNFEGNLDGSGNSINSLFVDFSSLGASGNTGFFSGLSSGASIENLTIQEFNLSVSTSDTFIDSGLVGLNEGAVENLVLESVEMSTEDRALGGLIGINEGIVNQSGVGTGFVDSNQISVGGLAAQASDTSEIYQSYSNADVEIGEGDQGGFIGSNQGKVRNSFYEGEILTDGADNIGGFIGSLEESVEVEETEIKNILSRADVPAELGPDALFGNIISGGVENAYYDSDESGVKGSAGEGFSTANLTGEDAVCNLDGFNFQEEWMVEEGEVPVLSWTTDAEGLDPTEVVCEGDLEPPILNFPMNQSDEVPIDTNLSVTVQGEGSFEQNITFYEVIKGEEDEEIETVTEVESGDIAEIDWSFRNTSATYDWYVEAENEVETVQSDIWNFTTEEKPGLTDEFPEHETAVSPGSDLEINVSNDRDDEMDVRFYSKEGDQLGEESGLQSGDRASIDPSDFGEEPDTGYEWYVVAETETTALKNTSESENYPDYFSFDTAQTIDAEIEELFGDQVNLNNGSADFGRTELELEMDGDQAATADVFNISIDEGTVQENVTNVEDGDRLIADIAGEVGENQASVDWTAEIWDEGEKVDEYTGSFSTYQAELSAQPESEEADEIMFYYSNQSSGDLDDFRNIGSVQASGTAEIDVLSANSELETGNHYFRGAAVFEGLRGSSIESEVNIP